jgi:hypothetical protein
VIPSLDRSAPLSGAGIASQEVEYVAFFRNQGLTATGITVGHNLKGILKDLAAYIDCCYQQFRKDRRFPGIATDNVVAVNGQLTGKVLTVTAASQAAGPQFGNLPRPVLRAYFLNQMVVMAPGLNPEDDYQMQFTFDAAPRKEFKVTVLSSQGGVSSQVVGLS